MPFGSLIAPAVEPFEADHEENECHQTDPAEMLARTVHDDVAVVVIDSREACPVAHQEHNVAELAMNVCNLLHSLFLRPRLVTPIKPHDGRGERA